LDDGTPQGSPLSPVIWLIYLANTLKTAKHQITEFSRAPTRRSARLTSAAPKITFQVDLFSHADDINPLVISEHTTKSAVPAGG